ncbi:MAG: YfcC family protein [Coprococcus sp.]|nr:YfcC family protein [Coprococcus sp.]
MGEPKQEKRKGLDISVRSFITAILIIFALMVLTYILTFLIPGGEYARIADENGNRIIDPEGRFTYIRGGLPFWKWILSPILVLSADGEGTIIAVILFLLVVGGAFNCLDKCGLMEYMLQRIVHQYGKVRYTLMGVVVLFFLFLGSFIGSFEECVPLVPIVVALSVSLGWDALTGMGMSILAVSCGFAAGVCNPFTVGVAQGLAGLPMFSGAWLRIVSFVLIYLLLMLFLRNHAKKVERPIVLEQKGEFEKQAHMDKGLLCFAAVLGVGILIVLLSGFVTALQDYTMIIVAVMFLAAGIIAPFLCNMKGRALASCFGAGSASICPAILMILMASSIKFTMVEANVLDTILHGAVVMAEGFPKWTVILFIYFIVLVMNFFIGSGSAKAFLLIPLIVPIAQIFGISPQLCIVAFAFGDGFSNVFYPTNPVLLISLGLAGVSYGEWVKWSWKFQAMNLALTVMILLAGLGVGYC